MSDNLAWHWLALDAQGKPVLRDGTPYKQGAWLSYRGEVVICRSGLHSSRRLIDSLTYCAGPYLTRVKIRGVVEEHKEKLVSEGRLPLWGYNALPVVVKWAERVADDAAQNAAEATGAATRAAAWYAARAARNAARAAARNAANAAEANAAEATGAATRAAAWYAARSARNAAGSAARNAAGAAAGATAWYAAGSAAGAAALDKYNTWLTEMIEAGRPRKR